MNAVVRCVCIALGFTFLVAAPARASILTVQGATTSGPGNCYPFGSKFGNNYLAFIYKDVPAFTIGAGDKLKFDLGAVNDVDITLDIDLAATTSNGGDVPAAAFVKVAADATASVPRGDTIAGNYELGFTVTQPFVFGGGGLIIRLKATGALASDTTCNQVMMYTTSADASGYFVKRVFEDADGLPPWENPENDYIAQFRIVTNGGIRVAVEIPAASPGQAVQTVAQLNDNTWFDFQATRVAAADVDTLAELASYDVLLIGTSGDNGDYDWNASVAGVWHSWASSGRGAVVSTAFTAYQLQTPGVPEMDPLVPFFANPSVYAYCATSTTTITQAHAVTNGLTTITTPTAEATTTAVEGTTLATMSCGNHPQVIVGSDGAGRLAYLGIPYMGANQYVDATLRVGSADRLLEQAIAWASDNDGDGTWNSEECFASGAEVCDGANIDEDCDGGADDADPQGNATGKVAIYGDGDLDGYGGGVSTGNECDPDANEYTTSTDCNDAAPGVNPAAAEVCDGANVNEDCDSGADDADPQSNATNKVPIYADVDGDGFGAGSSTGNECDPDTNESTTTTDCNDFAPGVNPAATEVCDGSNVNENCTGGADDADPLVDVSSKVAIYADTDGDGFGAGSSIGTECDPDANESTSNTDCNDAAPGVNPAAAEVCDGANVNEDCDSGADDLDPQGNATGKGAIYADADGDSYGAGVSTGSECDADANESFAGSDCNDAAPAVHPNATDVAGDAVDDDCNGSVVCWADADHDGARDDAATVASGDLDCTDVGEAATSVAIDCADSNGARHPGATELPNGIDDDCDATVDEGTTAFDDDSDGYTEVAGDCDDTDSGRHPGATELADGIDNDCDGTIDEATSAFDDDKDGVTEAAGDCDDDNATVHPSAPETVNGIDDDCDGTVDEGTSGFDDDGDGFTEDAGDCEDADAARNPDAKELANDLDDNCDGDIDEGLDGGGGCSAAGRESPWSALLIAFIVLAGRRRGPSPRVRLTPFLPLPPKRYVSGTQTSSAPRRTPWRSL